MVDIQCMSIRGAFVWGTVLICCLLPALLLFFLGYQVRQDWNDSASETTCIVKDNKVYADGSCYIFGRGYYTCYKGYTTVSHIFKDIEYTSEFYIEKDDQERDIVNYLDHAYAIGSDITCWFQKDEPSNIKLELDDSGIFLGFSITFMALSLIIVVLWLVYEVVDNADEKCCV